MGKIDPQEPAGTSNRAQPKGNPLRPDKPDALQPAPRRGVKQDDPIPAGSVRSTPGSPDID